MAEVVSTILRAHRVSAAPFSWNGRLECIHRTDSDGDLFFLFNFEESEMDVTCPSGLIDPLTGDGVGEKLTIDPRGWKLVRRIC